MFMLIFLLNDELFIGAWLHLHLFQVFQMTNVLPALRPLSTSLVTFHWNFSRVRRGNRETESSVCCVHCVINTTEL